MVIEDLDQVSDIDTGTVSPTGTDRSPGNTILKLDAHLGKPLADHPQYTQPELTAEQLSLLADALGEVGALEESALLEIERRRIVNNTHYAPMFTTYTLTRIAVQLVGVKVEAQIKGNDKIRDAVTQLSDLIGDSNVAPLDERYDNIGSDRVVQHEGDYIDPYRAIGRAQTVLFQDQDGDIISPDGSELPSDLDTPSIPQWHPPGHFK